MDWKQAIRDERAMLMRIVALLLSLADLAEYACSRSPAVAGLLYFILRPAEMAVCEFAACPSDVPSAPRTGGVRADLMMLALRLRCLACILQCQADIVFSFDSEGPYQSGFRPSGLGWMEWGADILKWLDVAHPVHAPDTS
jgi:hypothetical protein